MFFILFGDAGYKMRVGKGGSLQQVKENIREQILLANFRQQQFIILGDSQFGSSKRPKTQTAAKAKDWIKNKSSFRASSVSNIITSTRHAGKTIGISATTAVKTLSSLLRKGIVQYEYVQSKFSLWGSAETRYAFAEQNRPFPGCGYSLLKEGVLFYIGRGVKIK
jgi:hypothetical protein